MNRRIITLVAAAAAIVLIIAGSRVAYDRLSGKAGQTAPRADSAASGEQSAPGAAALTDFTVYGADGKAVGLREKAAAAGRPLVVNCWATWCPPCVEELPHFDALCSELDGKIEFMMVAMTSMGDTKEDVDSFVAENGYTFPVYYDDDGSALSAYAINAIPRTLFINSRGELVEDHLGALTDDTLRAFIDKLD